MKGRELKEACCNIRDSLEKKRETFVKKLIPKHPPVLNDWFRKTFPDAQVKSNCLRIICIKYKYLSRVG